MGRKGPRSGEKQQAEQTTNQGQQQQGHVAPSPARPGTADAVADPSVDDAVQLPLVDQRYLSDTKFAEFAISPSSKRAVAEVLRYERCSLVQAAAIPLCLGPEDVIAKAKTGTGKTLAFVIPVIEKVLARRAPRGKVSALVLSPTRELARQIQVETAKMLTFHPQLSSMVVYGGVDVKKNLRALAQRMPDILIATPGRCWDIMTQDHDPGMTMLLDSTRVLVLDEADNLLDMGFRPQIAKILNGLPPTAQRQTYLFSATFPTDVKSLADVALKRQHKYVDAVGEDVATHTHVEASSLVVPTAHLPMQLLGLLAQHMAEEPDYKVIVFLPTANLTAFFAGAFAAAGMHGVVEIHSRKSQPQRDRASALFRAESRLVLFSSDVSARGVDYPNVTYVVQLGAPSNREQYIHRAGRTGRAGRAGQGTLLLADFETPFLRNTLRDLPIAPLQPAQLPLQLSAIRGAGGSSPLAEGLVRDPDAALTRVTVQADYTTRARAYQSFLGYYKSHEVLKFRPEQVVSLANQYAAEVLGCPTPPGLLARTVAKMGLKGVPGIVITTDEGQQGRGQGQSRGQQGQGQGRGQQGGRPQSGSAVATQNGRPTSAQGRPGGAGPGQPQQQGQHRGGAPAAGGHGGRIVQPAARGSQQQQHQQQQRPPRPGSAAAGAANGFGGPAQGRGDGGGGGGHTPAQAQVGQGVRRTSPDGQGGGRARKRGKRGGQAQAV